jgi:hypothetical protein
MTPQPVAANGVVTLRGVVRGGTPPYRFAVRGLPRGLHASPAGSIHGSLDGAGRFLLQVTVRDAAGRRTAASIPLVVSS